MQPWATQILHHAGAVPIQGSSPRCHWIIGLYVYTYCKHIYIYIYTWRETWGMHWKYEIFDNLKTSKYWDSEASRIRMSEIVTRSQLEHLKPQMMHPVKYNTSNDNVRIYDTVSTMPPCWEDVHQKTLQVGVISSFRTLTMSHLAKKHIFAKSVIQLSEESRKCHLPNIKNRNRTLWHTSLSRNCHNAQPDNTQH